MEVVVALHHELTPVVQQLQRSEVGAVVGELLQFALPVDGIEVLGGVPHTNKIDHGILRVAPHEVVDVGIERLCDVALLTGLQLIDAQALAVALIAVAGHREPSHVAAVG